MQQKNVKLFYSILDDVTCLAHDMSRVAESLTDRFLTVKDLITKIRKCLCKLQLEFSFIKKNVQILLYRPKNTTLFYTTDYDALKSVIGDFIDPTSSALLKTKKRSKN